MATTERDLYELLGVPRAADETAIKKAYRKLARELHPDVSTAADAEARFREVSEAYEVLSNRELRQLYDRYGHAGLRSGGFQPTQFDLGSLGDLFATFFGDEGFGGGGRGGRARGQDVAAQVEIELVEAARGATVSVPFELAVECARCVGDGAEPGTAPTQCPRCHGVGQLQHVSRSVFGQFVRSQPCPDCGGRGQLVDHPCIECSGVGLVSEEKSVEVEIPEGIHDGQRIRLGGEGHAGALGGRSGDAYVLVRVKPDPRFVREGNDVYSQVDLTIVDAALGKTVEVETLDGIAELEFEPGTQPGEVRVLRGKGMPVLQGFGRGDQRVLVSVSVPRRVSDEQRRLLEEFERASDETTYRHDEGFFEKLKSAFR